jgi:hypothetical protein
MSNHEREDPRSGDGDAALDRAWRQASAEQPPAHLDAAIVASARKAVRDRNDAPKSTHTSGRSRNWPTGWQSLAAAAGVAGLAFALVQSLPPERNVAPAIQIDESVSGSTTAPESVRSQPAPGAKEMAVPADEPVSAEAPVAGAADEDASTDEAAAMRATEFDQRHAPVPEAYGRAASESIAAPARQRGDVAPMSANDWAGRVAALYASGDVAGAADTLRAFRMADPDADMYLPDSLRGWARTVE